MLSHLLTCFVLGRCGYVNTAVTGNNNMNIWQPFSCHHHNRHITHNIHILRHKHTHTLSPLMFSSLSHTQAIFTCIWLSYGQTLEKVVGVCGTVLGGLVLIATRAHYTIDIFVGSFVASTLWIIYHLILQSRDVRKYKFVWFFERDLQTMTESDIEAPQNPGSPHLSLRTATNANAHVYLVLAADEER